MTKTSIVQLCIILFALGSITGSYIQKKFNDSTKLSEERKQHQLEQLQDEAVQKVAEKVLTGISEWKQNTKDIVKEMHYEKVKPVFLNDCATVGYIGLYNSRQAEARKTLAGELKTEMPNRPTRP